MLTRYTKVVPANSPVSYLVTAGMMSAAILGRFALTPILGGNILDITLYPVVLMAAVLGGAGAGAFAVLVSVLVALFVFPRGGDMSSAEQFAESGLYLFGAGLSVIVAASLRAAVERLEVAQGRLVTVLDASGTGTWRWNMREDQVEWDAALCRLFGVLPSQSPRAGRDFLHFVHPDDHEMITQTVHTARTSGGADYEFRAIRADGAVRWMYSRVRLVRDTNGQPAPHMVGACLDVTEGKEAEERRKLLVHELNHRVKNTLSVVQSLAMLTLNGSKSLAAFRETFEARLFALSATHNILMQELWDGASIAEILSAELAPYGGLDMGRVRVSGEPTRLTPRQSVCFGMAFHELATNAAKYGALSVPDGHVEITWRKSIDADGKSIFSVEWVERGGPIVREVIRQGFGSRLIERNIKHELKGTVAMRFLPQGLHCIMTMPL
ncbi:sensor histidine kinase [Microvirga flavescens]|uniref:sensor histidine kinase n=1 Tax=Microvirga flavescens TaxID=2249811 RepID=UPI0018E08248|nr:HWE histidine kinase domain-containing protein [Microvirga flavescens]